MKIIRKDNKLGGLYGQYNKNIPLSKLGPDEIKKSLYPREMKENIINSANKHTEELIREKYNYKKINFIQKIIKKLFKL